MSSSERNAKIYGAVETETFMTFEGFCKKIYNNEQQKVEVFIDDEKIDTILSNQKISNIEDTYEVFDTEGFCFTYKLPKKYIGEKHKLEFKTIHGEQLVHSPIITIEKDNPLFNRGLLIQSLDEIINYNSIKDGYKKNTLSFMAIEENLKDNFFIEYILQICKRYKNLQLNIIYFKDTQKDLANELFKQIKNKIFSNPSNIKEIISNSEIYLHNDVEEFEFTTNQQFYNKVKDSEIIRNNLFIIELTKKAKEKKDHSLFVLNSITIIPFEKSIINEIFKNDERINEFKFMNSLSQVDEKRMKDIYCPNSIGFLATEENLEDEEFIDYIRKLIVKFPAIEFKGFCFNIINISQEYDSLIKDLSIKIIEVTDIENIAFNVSFWIQNRKIKIDNDIRLILFKYCNILYLYTDLEKFTWSLSKYELFYEKYFNDVFFNNMEHFGCNNKDIEQFSHSFYKIFYSKTMQSLGFTNFELDISMTLHDFNIFYTSMVFENSEFKYKMITLIKILSK